MPALYRSSSSGVESPLKRGNLTRWSRWRSAIPAEGQRVLRIPRRRLHSWLFGGTLRDAPPANPRLPRGIGRSGPASRHHGPRGSGCVLIRANRLRGRRASLSAARTRPRRRAPHRRRLRRRACSRGRSPRCSRRPQRRDRRPGSRPGGGDHPATTTASPRISTVAGWTATALGSSAAI